MLGSRDRGRRPSVLVIGAGMAGLSAAVHLHNNGCDVIVLEASSRPGGRMYTETFGQSSRDIVEIGANWIHGAALANPVISLASQHGLLKDSVLLDRMEGFCYRSDGKAIKREITVDMWNMLQTAEREAYSQLTLPPGVTSFEDHVRRRCTEYIRTKMAASDRDDARAVLNCMINYLRFHTGGFPHNMSVLYTYTKIPGGNVKVPLGMRSIVESLVNQIPSERIQYLTHVSRINWDSNNDVTVHSTNGEEYRADHVIVTVSLGVLKKHHASLFQPQLPREKISAIEKVGFGKVNKIFLHYDRPFWRFGEGSIKLAWTDNEAAIRSEKEWYKKIFCFDEVLNNPNVLVSWISGNEAEFMESLSDEEVLMTCTEIIRKFLGDQSIPRPKALIRSKWCTNPLVLGSYSYASKESGVEGYDVIAKPLCCSGSVPRVLFAGEATTNKMPSSMHGARMTGIREAERLLAATQMKATSRL